MNRRTHFGSWTVGASVGAFLVLLAATFAFTPRDAQAQASPLAQAQQQYDSGKFADAVTTLQAALASGTATGSDAVAARELLGRCQVKVGDTAGARKSFLALLRQDPQYRLDAVRTPPDEVAVFNQALNSFQAEQLKASQRLPASINAFYGIGSGSNEDFGEYVAIGGGDKKFDNKPMFGLGVRFPIAPRWSLDLELQRFRATNEDSVSGLDKAQYEVSATPLAISLSYLVLDRGKIRANLFAGGGPMLNSYVSDKFLFFGVIPLNISDSKVGTYIHGGIEGEYVLHPKLSVTGRALFRSAKANKMYKGSTFTQYSSGLIGNRNLDFSGYGVSLGLRGYIGY